MKDYLTIFDIRTPQIDQAMLGNNFLQFNNKKELENKMKNKDNYNDFGNDMIVLNCDKIKIEELTKLYDLGFRIVGLLVDTIKLLEKRLKRDIKYDETFNSDFIKILEKATKDKFNSLIIDRENKKYYLTTLLMPLDENKLEDITKKSFNLKHVIDKDVLNKTKNTIGSENKLDPTYMQLMDSNIRLSAVSEASKNRVNLTIDVKKLMEKRRIYVDPEGANYFAEIGKSFLVMGGVPKDCLLS
jgi:hypothetical protein